MNEMVKLLDSVNGNFVFDSDYVYNGNIVPRVTKIISRCNHNDSLMYWANNLGFKRKSYEKVLSEAASIGSQCHENIDAFLTDENHILPVGINHNSCNAYYSFRRWFDDINKYAKVEVIYHEKQLVCKYFGGTLDGLYKIDDKVYLVDYKTSNHISYNYCLQLAAYRYMLKSELGINIDGCIILQLDKNSISYNEYILNFSNPYHLSFIDMCEQTFLSLVYAYYNLTAVETYYDRLNWKVT